MLVTTDITEFINLKKDKKIANSLNEFAKKSKFFIYLLNDDW